ncbi:DUF4811 domain-containing protein [Weissella koreensis]|uniref:DUF4811 domain-containing protein n=1 Tax=Weissella koreensis TaxID=165096 RepID=UPI0002174E88|nr:DUF4811 domain-containing protein [Weissella koreensis]AEJ23321.1 hypothetical protein WKK_02235 [Weissella koreensis KACC 15510]MCZ9310831.1 DUF4811 domain-containing protein [Weissella koreensis]
MLILLFIGAVLLVLAGITYFRRKIIRWSLLIIGIILLVASGIGVYMAPSHHLFMKKQVINKTIKMDAKTVVNDKSFIVTTSAKNSKFEYHYKWKNKSYRITPKTGTTNVVKGSTAAIKENISNYQAKNFFDKFMLVGLPTSTEPDVKYTFVLPDNWYIISSEQDQQIQDKVKDSKSGLEDKIKEDVTSAVKEEVKKNSDYLNDKTAQKKTQDEIVKSVTSDIDKNLDNDVNNMLKDWHLK